MASAAGYRSPKCHVLNYFYDKYDGSALTVLVNSVRFHIIADGKKLRSKDKSAPDAKLAHAYEKLLAGVKEEEGKDITKPCSKQNLRSGSQGSSANDSGHGTGDEAGEDGDKDSAVDLTEHKSPAKGSDFLQQAQENPDQALYNWMLSSFGSIFDERAPTSGEQKGLSLQEWYDRPSLFFSIEIKDGQLVVIEDEATPDMERRMADIIPKMFVPKHIRDMNIPWYPSSAVTVLDASDEPAPYHPSRVQVDKEISFSKMVDPTQAGPTKREIRILKKIEELGLHKQIRVPLIKGLVGYEGSNVEMMGFLQTAIEDPIPLTKLLDDEVPQAKRDKWAKESEKFKDILHQNGIVWGDAKADNFMVDKNDDLWIIDFGGSYTDGWVDQELMDTEEGDDQGVSRVVDALHDPSTYALNVEEGKISPERPQNAEMSPGSDVSTLGTKKRRAEDSDDHKPDEGDVERSLSRKRARRQKSEPSTDDQHDAVLEVDEPAEDTDIPANAGETNDQEQYCFCNKPSSGDMIGCDNDGCKRQWFHFNCVGLESAPKSKHWYCDDCKAE